jgi:dTDP-4-amino-4,6-dideoxygalactose transaminase
MGYRRGDFPLAYEWSRRILSLPFYPEITESEIEEVAAQIENFYKGDGTL